MRRGESGKMGFQLGKQLVQKSGGVGAESLFLKKCIPGTGDGFAVPITHRSVRGSDLGNAAFRSHLTRYETYNFREKRS